MYRFKKLKKINKSFFNSKSPIIFLLIAILTLGIGYAQVSNVNLHINGNATAQAEEELLITNIQYDSNNDADPNDCIIRDSYLTIMNSTIKLGDSLSSSITYKVTIRNNTNSPAIYDDAVYDIGIGYDNTDIEFVVNGIQNGDTLNSQEEVDITITFKYIDSLTTINNQVLNSYINFRFNNSTYVARIDDNYFDTIQDAIDAVPNNSQTTIVLLKDTSEKVEVNSSKNIVFDLNNKTWQNVGNTNVIVNYGVIKLINGEINSDATSNGAINNESGATIDIDGARIVVSGGRQALYNNKGNATIRGDSYLSTTSTERSAVQTTSGGTLSITGGTIIATRFSAITNAGSLTIGTEDGDPAINSISIQGDVYGVNSTPNFNFYDGTIKGKNAAVNNLSKIVDIEDGYSIANGEEIISDITYKTIFLATTHTVTFNPTGGRVNEATRNIAHGMPINTLPIPTRNNYSFDGWYTDPQDGTEIDASTIINGDVTFYAHWIQILTAEVNGDNYYTLQAAINAVNTNTETTITILRDINETVTVSSTKNIILDLGNYTFSNFNDNTLIENNGTVKIINGNYSTNADTALINNNSGAKVIITGGNLTSTGSRQVIYNNGGEVTISGNAYLSSTTIGSPSSNYASLARATVQNLVNGVVNINGGTIIGVNQQAVSNEGTLNIGIKDGNINSSTPIIRGETYGIVSIGTLNYYDGITMGITGAINGSVNDIETNSQFIEGIETINNKTYSSKHLENN